MDSKNLFLQRLLYIGDGFHRVDVVGKDMLDMPGFQKLQAALPLADLDLHHVKADGVPPVRTEILRRRVDDVLPLAKVDGVNGLLP